MEHKKRLYFYLATSALALATAGSVAISGVSAASVAKHINPMTGLVTAIAQKFNLPEADVQKVFDEQKVTMRAKMQADMTQRFTDRVNQAVKDGMLTQDQANKIFAKKAELDALKTSLEGKSKEEIQAALKTQMTSLKQWATDNNIPLEYLLFGGLKGGKGHFGAGFFMEKPVSSTQGQNPKGTTK